jgi:hypothetical protein
LSPVLSITNGFGSPGTHSFRGFTNYGITFLVGVVVGVLVQAVAAGCSAWTSGLPPWGSALLWTFAPAAVGGWLCGFSLAYRPRAAGGVVSLSTEPDQAHPYVARSRAAAVTETA